MNKYEILIYWNEVDEVVVAEMPELKGCIAHAEKYNEALANVMEVAIEWLRIAYEKGWQIPVAKGRLMYA